MSKLSSQLTFSRFSISFCGRKSSGSRDSSQDCHLSGRCRIRPKSWSKMLGSTQGRRHSRGVSTQHHVPRCAVYRARISAPRVSVMQKGDRHAGIGRSRTKVTASARENSDSESVEGRRRGTGGRGNRVISRRRFYFAAAEPNRLRKKVGSAIIWGKPSLVLGA